VGRTRFSISTGLWCGAGNPLGARSASRVEPAPNHPNNEWPRFRPRADSILSPDQLTLDRLPFGRCTSPVISREILRASFRGFPFASSAIPFDVTIPDAINVATASFRNLLAHSLSSGLVERVLGGSRTVRASPRSLSGLGGKAKEHRLSNQPLIFGFLQCSD
jgi:hypothetical protein